MPTCDKHGIKISWKEYPKCPACEHIKCEHIKMETMYVRQNTAEENKQLQADLAQSQRVIALMAEDISRLAGFGVARVCPTAIKGYACEEEKNCVTPRPKAKAIECIIKYYVKAAEGKG